MILLLGGTSDAELCCRALERTGRSCILSTATGYDPGRARHDRSGETDGPSGNSGQPQSSRCERLQGMLDRKKLLDLVQNRGIQLIIDATHPFAENVSRTAMAVCADTGCGYLRYQRKPEPLPENQLIERSPSAEQAAEKLAEEKGNVLLTTGSRSLALFARRIHRDRLFARVLPRSESLGECERCGLLPSHLMAMQGPFDQELNGYLIRRFDVEWMVSKQSGSEGGLREKIAACLEHETKLLVIDPPDLAYSEIVHTTGELIERLNRIIEE